MFNYHLYQVDHASSNDVRMKHLRYFLKPPKRVAQNFHFAFLRIKVTRASRGLSAIAELLVVSCNGELNENITHSKKEKMEAPVGLTVSL